MFPGQSLFIDSYPVSPERAEYTSPGQRPRGKKQRSQALKGRNTNEQIVPAQVNIPPFQGLLFFFLFPPGTLPRAIVFHPVGVAENVF